MLVIAIALTIGIGTGAFAGLTSTSTWRRTSNDASYAAVRMFDLRVRFVDGTSVPQGELAKTIRDIPNGDRVTDVQERLVLRIQVDASVGDQTILVPGQLIGVDVATTPLIAGMSAREGRALDGADAGQDVAVLDYHFGREKKLSPTGTIRISGGHELAYVGQILTPEYFLVTTAAGGLFAESNFAAVVAPRDTVQRLTGRPDSVNDAVILLRPGTDPRAAAEAISAAIAVAYPSQRVDVETASEDDAYKVLYDDIDTDQKFYSIFAFVILAGATLAAFNLTSRIVESQRRQIGIAMALGVPRRWLAFRPLLVGGQVALLGVALGIGVGLLIDVGMDALLRRFFPLPVWSAPFQPWVFAQAAVLGFVMPFVACLYPVFRAVSVPPIAAIRTGFLSAGSSGWAPLARRLRLPGGVFMQMPIRNVLRTPRRTVLTSLGIAAAVTVFVGTTGLTDTFLHTIDVGEGEVLKGAPNRIVVAMDGFQPAAGVLRDLEATGVVDTAEANAILSATAKTDGHTQGLVVALTDFKSAQWSPTILTGTAPQSGSPTSRPEILLSQPGAEALGLKPGDLVTVSYKRKGSGIQTDTEMLVTGTSPDVLKTDAYMAIGDADVFGLKDLTNQVSVIPVGDRSLGSVQKALFNVPGVASVQAINATAKVFRHLVDQYLSLLTIVQYTALALALLIAFNSATIALDERVRENATMLAFGVRIRRVLTMAVLESAIVGVLGTLLGIAMGRVVIELIIRLVVVDVVPNIGFTVAISPTTILSAAALGIGVVALAPLLGARRLGRLDVPSALRVVE